MQFSFGTGTLTLIPAGSNPTPIEVAILQDINVDISYTEKDLRGADQFPVDIARGPGKISGKAKSGNIRGSLIAAVLAGSTGPSTGSKIGVHEESGTIPATPYTITVANGATFHEDLGVLAVATGLYFTRVASAPATGQYSVNTTTGVYTFAAADTTLAVKINYSYTGASTGVTIALSNQLMGTATTFVMTLYNTYAGKKTGIRFYAVTVPKMAISMKNEDHTMTDIDFSCYANSSGQLIDIYTAE